MADETVILFVYSNVAPEPCAHEHHDGEEQGPGVASVHAALQVVVAENLDLFRRDVQLVIVGLEEALADAYGKQM